MTKVLVVDDEPHIRALYSLELKEDGYEVFTADSCRSLLHKAARIRPDAVIMDARLADCDALEALVLLRSGHPELPILLCSTCDSHQHDSRAKAADDSVIKSFDLSELKAKLTRMLQTPGALPSLPNYQCHKFRYSL